MLARGERDSSGWRYRRDGSGTDEGHSAKPDQHCEIFLVCAISKNVMASVVIGGGVCFNKLTEHPLVRARYPLLAQACHYGGIQPNS
jgi:hypothetical protein